MKCTFSIGILNLSSRGNDVQIKYIESKALFGQTDLPAFQFIFLYECVVSLRYLLHFLAFAKSVCMHFILHLKKASKSNTQICFPLQPNFF